MEYFVMCPDDRSLAPLKIRLSLAEMETAEPFVTYAEFNDNTNFMDYYYTKNLFKYCFFVSDGLKELLAVYEEHIRATPFFITDNKRQSQKVYWKIEVNEADCVEIKDGMDYNCLTVLKGKIKSRYIFKVVFDKQEYIIVSLHMAENILRKNMSGIRFIPVNLK